ncbi:MBD domain-containing protein [Durusdinium trenchii]|uniref:MBD domain-containing protein n=1 Tax=Durusdinium trenchii TaxID=1381693 RepID=A0ABP0LF09_9DINO
MTAHMGPIPLPDGGTLTADDRARIQAEHAVSAAVRFRQQWGQRCLSLSGPPERLAAAKKLAEELIRKNGTEGGRITESNNGGNQSKEVQALRQQLGRIEGQMQVFNTQMQWVSSTLATATNAATTANQMATQAAAVAAQASALSKQAMEIVITDKKRKKATREQLQSESESDSASSPSKPQREGDEAQGEASGQEAKEQEKGDAEAAAVEKMVEPVVREVKLEEEKKEAAKESEDEEAGEPSEPTILPPNMQENVANAAVLGAVLSDEKSLKELWSLRGAAGTKPCCLCQNVVGHMSREDVASHEWLVHYSCTNRTRFAKHTSASFQAMRDRLALVAAAGSKKELNALGQCFGLQYNDLGVLWHPTLKDQVCPVSQTMYDWMHVLVASGGVAQYEVNEFAKAVQQLGIPLSTLDQFSRTVILPWGRKNIPRDFFQERINPENDSHVRAFATEVMVALPILALFIETVLEPNSLLPEHCTSLKLMAEIIDILTKMDGAVHLATQLRDAVDKHGILFDKLYPGCVKPKAHWKFHIPEQIQSFGVNMSCFSPERKHRAIKAIASHVFNDAISGSVCLRIGYDTIQHFAENDNCCRAMHLEGPVREVEDGAKMLNFWSNEVSSVSLAKKIKTPVGVVAKGDLVLALDERMALRPHVFLEAVLITGTPSTVRGDAVLDVEWSKVDAGLVEAFFYDHPDLRGENLRQKLEQTVMDWKTKTTRMEFNQESTYMDEVDLKKKYESRPELLAAILENAHRFFCPVKKVLLYADPEYKGRVSDVTENGTTEKRKCATGLLDTEEQNKKKRGKNGKPTEPGKDDKPKLKAGEKKKMTKKVEVLTAKKLQLNDLISKAGGYGDMIPAYVRTHAQEAVDTVDAGIRNAQNIIDDNKGDVKNMMEELDKVLESGAGAADRLKAQLEAAAAFNV